MSTINPGAGGGNTITPGRNTAAWSTYQAVSNVDFDNFEIQNAKIDLSGDDSLSNVNITDSTLTGTTTLSGDITNGANARMLNPLTLANPGDYGCLHFKTGGAPDIYMGFAEPADDTTGYRINSNVGTGTDFGLLFQAKTGAGNAFEDIAQIVSTQASSSYFGAPGKKGIKCDDLIHTEDLYVNNAVDVSGALEVGGNVDIAGNVVATGDITGANIEASGFGTIGTLGDMGCANLVASSTLTAQQLTATGNLTITSGGGFVDFTGVRVSGTLGESGATDSRIFTEKSSVKWLGTAASAEDVNGLSFVAPNDTSRAFVFLGQRDAGTTSSMGLASKNAFSSTIVGFAPSAISGIEKWSFTGKHQCSFTGKIMNEHRGMVVESVGRVCGLAEKGKLKYTYDKDDPEDYSNASPVVRLCGTKASKKVIGVVKEITESPDTKGDLVVQWDENGYTKGDRRVMVNAIGEGLVWVADSNGKIYNGDLIQSSNITGYAERQSDDLIRSSTIAKITADCDFIQERVSVKHILKDDEGNNVLDSEGRLIWVNSDEKRDKFEMRYLEGGRKAVLLPCIYYCG